MTQGRYIAIDLKSFFASVECVERGLDPLDTNLVVADEGRTEKTVCLAVTPPLKACGIPGRARLFEVVQRVREINGRRRRFAPGGSFAGTSNSASELRRDSALELGYIVARPRMAKYMAASSKIYSIYLRRIAPEDIHVYSIDEVFIDAAAYLGSAGMTARELAAVLISEVYAETGITATAGIGTNLYLCKIALDIVAKRVKPDENGVRIAELDEESYRRTLWDHRPLTDFWRVGRGTARRLEENGIYTMGDIARCSLGGGGEYYSEDLLYRIFGVGAELLIDHAWGWEPCTMADIRAYRPESSSLASGQVLGEPYTFEKARVVMREMADVLSLELVSRGAAADRFVLTVCYDTQNPSGPGGYCGEISKDIYGRRVPKHAHGTANLERPTSSTREIVNAFTSLFDRLVNRRLLVRRIYVTACRVAAAGELAAAEEPQQLDLFGDEANAALLREQERERLLRERSIQEVVLHVRRRYGKNALLRGTSFTDGATARERNAQIGGHRA